MEKTEIHNDGDCGCLKKLSTDAGMEILSGLLGSHADAVFLCGDDFQIINRNHSASIITSHYKNGKANPLLFDVFPELAENTFKNRIQSALEGNKVAEFLCGIRGTTYRIKCARMFTGLILQFTEITNPLSPDSDLDNNNFKMLFENMTSGFLFLKKTENYDGTSDFEIIDINSTFEMYFDVERDNIIGRPLSRILPAINQSIASKLDRIALHGRAMKEVFENPQTHRHLEVKMFSPRIGYAAAVFNDIKAEIEQRNDLFVKNEVSKAFALGGDTDVYKAIIDLVQHNTQSPCGFIGYPMDDANIKVLAVNDQNANYALTNDEGEFVANMNYFPAGLESLKSKDQVSMENINGHKYVLITPILNEDELVGLIGLADSPQGYDQKSKDFVRSLADYAAPLMHREIKDYHYKRELIKAKEIAEQNEKLKTAFLGNISHEIRTPLNSIAGFSDLLCRSGELTPKQFKYADTICKAAKNLVNIVNSIVELSKIETRQVKVSNTSFCLNDLIDDLLDIYKNKADTKGLALIPQKGLDKFASYIYTDRTKIHRIMSTLVDNGLKFTEKGEVSFGYKYIGKDNALEFFVRDTGIGIRKEMQSKIFTSFLQDEKTLERQHGGVGVGLSICNSYIKMLGSTIIIESEPQKGSLFHFAIGYNTQPKDN
ncbi:MAG: hypothetical protein J6Z01_10315 [Bacteroidales bacterium]|nr:hypothetical protein [Bacteroidales bacterium]